MSAFTECLGEVLIGVTEDLYIVTLHFENGRRVTIQAKAPDSRLEASLEHTDGCKRRASIGAGCSCGRARP